MRYLTNLGLAVGLLATAACERDTTRRADHEADELYQQGKQSARDVGRDVEEQARETTRDVEEEARELRDDLRPRGDAETSAQLSPDQDPWENTREYPDPRAQKPADITAQERLTPPGTAAQDEPSPDTTMPPEQTTPPGAMTTPDTSAQQDPAYPEPSSQPDTTYTDPSSQPDATYTDPSDQPDTMAPPGTAAQDEPTTTPGTVDQPDISTPRGSPGSTMPGDQTMDSDREFEHQRQIKLATLSGVHATIASEPVVIRAAGDALALNESDKALLDEKVQELQRRVDETSTLIMSLRNVDASNWSARNEVVDDSMRRLQAARDDAWQSLHDAANHVPTSMR